MSAMFYPSLRAGRGLIAMIPNLFVIPFFFGLMGAAGAVLHFLARLIASIALGIVADDTIRPSRLWQGPGKREGAPQRSEQVYGWFAEGLDTADLKEAQALLRELS